MLAYIYSLAAVMLLMWGAGSALGPTWLHLTAIAIGAVMIGLLSDYALNKVRELNLADMRFHANKTFWRFEREAFCSVNRSLMEENEELRRRLSALEEATTEEHVAEDAWPQQEGVRVTRIV